MKKMTITVDGKEVSALTQKIGTTLWVHMNGRTFTYEPEKKVQAMCLPRCRVRSIRFQ